MIYTVTLNPALDRTLVVDRLMEDDTVRVREETCYAGGKGIDVSRVIRELGGHSVALGFVGGYGGSHLEGLLINAGVLTDFVRIGGETRTNIIVKEAETGRQFVLSAAGPEVRAAEIGALYHHILGLPDMDHMVLSGSLPRGVSPSVYGQLVLAARRKGAFVVLDADGEALREALNYRPHCIKPNRHELSRLVDRDLSSQEEIVAACRDIHRSGVPFVLVSRGKEGLILSCAEGPAIRAVGPPVQVDSTVGAGDSAVAGFVLAHWRGQGLEECIRLACAAGTATAMTPGTELCHRRTVEEILPQVVVEMLPEG
ncbi:6-phosphofructokinase 2 [Desulfacinum hydrothermale DSM 13146]|uniref:1-phosphofructokinase n=1 Tax=Desulfacinum hydrothermale DSM 13146 TaxID=1121390 RepID=A0A1W1XLL7_9BACT|nr:1-phosphofructokinase [Desulfacinum hydrothermale]SMC24441.1 6-phosphofructokinase 2 [Desulfacinum hydrothermale DSM 13146]